MSGYISNFSNVTNYTSAFQKANTMTDGYFMFGLIVVTYACVFLYYLPNGKWKSLTYSSFIAGILGLMMNLAGMLQWYFLVIIAFGFVAGLFMMLVAKRD